jgi:hypothetical protein
MKQRTVTIILITTLIFGTLLLLGTPNTVKADPGTTHVPGDYSTITLAIAAANPGDTIIVAPGTYKEEVVIDKSLTIIGGGASSTFIDGSGVVIASAGLVKITAAGDVTFSEFTIENAPLDASLTTFGILSECNTPGVTYTISNSRIIGTGDTNPADFEAGFYSQHDQANVIFKYNTITNEGGNNMVFEVHTGATEISHNNLEAGLGGGDSVFFMTYDASDVTTLQNVSYNSFNMGTGSDFDYSHRSTGVTFAAPGPAYGVGEAKFTNMVISGNTFNNLESNRRGIGFWIGGTGNDIVSPLITDNTVIGIGNPANSSGVDFVGSGLVTGAIITGNVISGTETAVYLRSGDAAGTTINYNNIAGNTIGLNWIGGSQADARFNWWGSATGPNPPGSGDVVVGNADISHYLHSQFAARLYTDPSPVLKSYSDIGQTFVLSVKIANFEDFFGFDVKLTWDNTLITFVNVDNTPLNTTWPQGFGVALSGNGPGYFRYVAVAQGGNGFTGSGTLLILTFHVEKGSNIVQLHTPIHFDIAKLSNSLYTSIPAEVDDGLYQISATKPGLELRLFDPNPAKPFECSKVFQVQVYVNHSCSQLTGYNLIILYDTELFYLKGVDWTGSVLGTGTYVESPHGTINALKTSGTPWSGSEGLLLTLTFNVSFDGRPEHIWKTNTPHDLSRNISFFDAQLTFTEGTLPASGIKISAPMPVTIHVIRGDVTCDGKVDVDDLRVVAYYYDAKQGDSNWGTISKYDLNNDGTIDIFDLVVVAANFWYGYGP